MKKFDPDKYLLALTVACPHGRAPVACGAGVGEPCRSCQPPPRQGELLIKVFELPYHQTRLDLAMEESRESGR